MKPELISKIAEYIQCTATALDLANKAVGDLSKKAEQNTPQVNEEVIPQIIDMLCKQGHIQPWQREEAYKVLHDHNQTLDVLQRLLVKSANTELGEPDGSTQVTHRFRVLGDTSSGPSEADLVFERKLGLRS